MSFFFVGVKSIQRALKLEKGIHVPQNVIIEALNEIPSYVQHLRPIRRFERAHYDVTALYQLW